MGSLGYMGVMPPLYQGPSTPFWERVSTALNFCSLCPPKHKRTWRLLLEVQEGLVHFWCSNKFFEQFIRMSLCKTCPSGWTAKSERKCHQQMKGSHGMAWEEMNCPPTLLKRFTTLFSNPINAHREAMVFGETPPPYRTRKSSRKSKRRMTCRRR